MIYHPLRQRLGVCLADGAVREMPVQRMRMKPQEAVVPERLRSFRGLRNRHAKISGAGENQRRSLHVCCMVLLSLR